MRAKKNSNLNWKQYFKSATNLLIVCNAIFIIAVVLSLQIPLWNRATNLMAHPMKFSNFNITQCFKKNTYRMNELTYYDNQDRKWNGFSVFKIRLHAIDSCNLSLFIFFSYSIVFPAIMDNKAFCFRFLSWFQFISNF